MNVYYIKERAKLSTEIIGLSGYANASTQKSSETVATESLHLMSADKQDTTNLRAEELIDLVQTTIQARKTEDFPANLSVVDNQKVEQIRQAIREGSYRIDARRIASKLIALERDLGK